MRLTDAVRVVIQHRRDAAAGLPDLDDVDVYREVYADDITIPEVIGWEVDGDMPPDLAAAYRTVIAAGWHPCHAALDDVPRPLLVVFS